MDVSGMLKEGTKYLTGKEDALMRLIEAAAKLGLITRTSLGPNGRNKIVINHLEKLFVTNDAATILKELDVIHPAAKMIVMAAQQQEQEIGDGTNLVVVLSGELLAKAGELVESGLHTSEIVSGFEKAGQKAIEILQEIVVHKVENVKDLKQVTHVLTSAIGSKQYGFQQILAPHIAQACIQVCPKNASNFNVDNVRVTKLVGGGVSDTVVVKGFVLARGAEGAVKHVKDAKVAVFASGIDVSKTETKGTVLLKSADELLNYSKGEEKQMEDLIKAVAGTGTNVIVSGSSIGDLALHFLERYKIMVIKVPSKFQLRRVCKATGATPLVKLGAPTQEELGHCSVVNVEEIGSTQVTIFRQDNEASSVSTVVVRGSTDNILDDVERAIDDGVNVYKGLCKDPRFVAGAAASEIELSRRLQQFADATPGLEQYAIRKFAEAFEVIPRVLGENAGVNATELISNLYAAHAKGTTNAGVNVDSGEVEDAVSMGILDLVASKINAIRLCTTTANTLLKVDQIIMSKPAGGPKPPKQGAADAGDDF